MLLCSFLHVSFSTHYKAFLLGVGGLSHRSRFSLSRYCQIVFQRLPIYTPTGSEWIFQELHIFVNTLFLLKVFVWMYVRCSCILFPWWPMRFEHPFICWFPIWKSLLWNAYWNHLPTFIYNCLFHWFVKVWSCYVTPLNHYGMIVLSTQLQPITTCWEALIVRALQCTCLWVAKS